MNQSKIYQLDFFLTPEESQIEALNKRVDHIGDSTNKVRKSLFAKNGELVKRMTDIESRMQILEKYICQGGHYG